MCVCGYNLTPKRMSLTDGEQRYKRKTVNQENGKKRKKKGRSGGSSEDFTGMQSFTARLSSNAGKREWSIIIQTLSWHSDWLPPHIDACTSTRRRCSDTHKESNSSLWVTLLFTHCQYITLDKSLSLQPPYHLNDPSLLPERTCGSFLLAAGLPVGPSAASLRAKHVPVHCVTSRESGFKESFQIFFGMVRSWNYNDFQTARVM